MVLEIKLSFMKLHVYYNNKLTLIGVEAPAEGLVQAVHQHARPAVLLPPRLPKLLPVGGVPVRVLAPVPLVHHPSLALWK